MTSVLTTNGRTALSYTGYMNGESFQQDGIVTAGDQQYAAFWDEDGYVNVSRRRTPDGAWQNVRLTDYRTTSTDSHNTISIGVAARDGSIHLAFDMHSSELRYRRSADAVTWSPVATSLAGTTLDQVTYPQFIPVPDGTLQLAIRTGLSGSGDEVLFEYANDAWTYLGKFLDGTSAGNNPYLFGIEYDRAGLLHATWTVRETPDPSTNHDLYYAYSPDRGRTWHNNAGAVLATPLLPDDDALRVWDIARNRGLINQEAQAVDAAGVVHVLASHLPDDAPDQTDFAAARENAVLVHYWRNPESKVWRRNHTSFRGGLSRGDVAADSAGNLHVVCTDSSTRRLHVGTASKASGWTGWETRHVSDPIYYSDPLIDRARLRAQGVLSVFAPRHGGGQIDVQDWPVGPG
ncbi:BNR repeat-containing protein [Paractinoplanes rishiriensis]|uniref:Uncharacterized protein n=1 Tax=Paractinoplanes rishiriensis TaxID=1050105 RepID=A0A919MS47_9ACTN|nr:BNR repeat-containing protein [Actinoplanes rishiriensis]GIE93263.1 hypothetical protein Ari01nite_07280 [Actinoplanes rishiriensis]